MQERKRKEKRQGQKEREKEKVKKKKDFSGIKYKRSTRYFQWPRLGEYCYPSFTPWQYYHPICLDSGAQATAKAQAR